MRKLLILLILFSSSLFGDIKAIVFDFGGVIINFDRDQLLTFVQDHLQLSSEEACKAIVENDFPIEKLPANWTELFHQTLHSCSCAIPGMMNLVHHLKEDGYLVALFSNISGGSAYYFKELGFYDHFNPCFLSYEMGIKKPEPESYLRFLEGMPCEADEIIFIDDREENVIGAREFGINAIHFQGNLPQLHAELAFYGIQLI